MLASGEGLLKVKATGRRKTYFFFAAFFLAFFAVVFFAFFAFFAFLAMSPPSIHQS